LKIATIVNAEIIQLEEKTGSIEIGKWADIIVVDGQPDEDINVIRNPEQIPLAMREGVLLKNLLN